MKWSACMWPMITADSRIRLEVPDEPAGHTLAAVEQQRRRVGLDEETRGGRVRLRGRRPATEDGQAHVEAGL